MSETPTPSRMVNHFEMCVHDYRFNNGKFVSQDNLHDARMAIVNALAERDTLRAVLKEAEGHERNATARAERAEAELASLKNCPIGMLPGSPVCSAGTCHACLISHIGGLRAELADVRAWIEPIADAIRARGQGGAM